MENSREYGPCPGSNADGKMMVKVFKDTGLYGRNIKALASRDGTVKNVKAALKDVIKNDLAVFYYSGHGDRDKFNEYSTFDLYAEPDNINDFLCLYDGPLMDNEIWDIISTSKNSVVCIFDCCHSETMYRSPDFSRMIDYGATHYTNFTDMIARDGILVISGSPEDDYSYGSAFGGELTLAINRHLKTGTNYLSYANLIKKLESDRKLTRKQTPQITIINGFNINRRAFIE